GDLGGMVGGAAGTLADWWNDQSTIRQTGAMLGSGRNPGETIAQSLASAPSSFAPSLLFQLAKYLDPVQRETNAPDYLHEAANRLAARLPWVSRMLPPK